MLTLRKPLGLGLGGPNSKSSAAGPPDVLASLTWAAARANSTLSQASGRARVTTTDANPAAISKGAMPLKSGKTYKFVSPAVIYLGTAIGNCYVRVSSAADMSNGDYFSDTAGGGVLDINNRTFTVPSNVTAYFGIVTVPNAIGQYSEIDAAIGLLEI